MRSAFVELVVGIFIILVVIALVLLAFKTSSLASYSGGSTYTVTADFDNVGDLKVRAPVTVSGVSIGQITSIKLDPKTFQAVVTMAIKTKYKDIPDDSTANIFTEGLLGANYISLSPGYSEVMLENGSVLHNTNPALILQNLIGQLLFSMKGDKEDGKDIAKENSGNASVSPIPHVNTSLQLSESK